MSNLDVSKSKVTNGKAIASLILGILSIVTFILTLVGIILGIIGLILGIIGLKEINRFTQDGRKMAVAGVICSSFGILLPILLLVFSFLVFANLRLVE